MLLKIFQGFFGSYNSQDLEKKVNDWLKVNSELIEGEPQIIISESTAGKTLSGDYEIHTAIIVKYQIKPSAIKKEEGK